MSLLGWCWPCWLFPDFCLVIEMTSLTFTYPEATSPALADVSLQIEAGEFILLTGASGSGKSTLMRCLNGLIPHLSGGTVQGRIRVGGLDPIAAGPQAMSQKVAFVFQNPEAQAVLDIVEPEIAFGLENNPHENPSARLSAADRAERRAGMKQRVDKVLAQLAITHPPRASAAHPLGWRTAKGGPSRRPRPRTGLAGAGRTNQPA